MSNLTRVCGRCKVEQPLDQFYLEAEARATIRKGKKHKMPCRGCQQRYQAERRAPRQAMADKIKMDAGCMDCGLKPKYAQVLEFDHRPDEVKLFHISDRMVSGTVEDLLSEIAKCDVVCANCHRVRTVIKNQFGQALGTTRANKAQVYKDRLAGIGHIWENSPAAMADHMKHPDQLELDLFAA